jgi:TPR repeat protein
LYAAGKGLPRDGTKAYFWLTLAVNGGVKEAGRERHQVSSKLSPEQIAKSDEAAKAWRPKVAKK